MPPVGNDIVDLGEPGNRGKSGDGRFLGRVFTPEERELIAGADDPDALLWSLWAAKEAAYKAVSRANPEVCSIPRRYRVIMGTAPPFCPPGKKGGAVPFFSGRVFTPRGELALRIAVAKDYVHALAAGSESELERTVRRVDRLGVVKETGGYSRAAREGDCENAPDPSAFVRGLVLREIARRSGCPLEELTIRNDPAGPAVPRVFLRGLPFAADISLSHDGRFFAFALLAH